MRTTYLSVLISCFGLHAQASDMSRLARDLAKDGARQAEAYTQEAARMGEQRAPLDAKSQKSIDDIVSRSQQGLREGGHQALIQQLESDGQRQAHDQMESAQQIVKQTEQDLGQQLSPFEREQKTSASQSLPTHVEVLDPLKLNQEEMHETAEDSTSEGCGQKRCRSKAIQMSNPLAVSEDVAVRGHQLLIFVSTSMPSASLQAYSQVADQIGARLILRGLVGNSFQATHQHFINLGINVDIDPPLFEQFDVTHVPTFVHASIKDGQYVIQGHDRLQGHISVHDALQIFKDKGQIDGADAWLKQIETTDAEAQS